MKRCLFLILAAICSLPNIGFAQNGPMLINVPRDLQSVDPARAAWNSMMPSLSDHFKKDFPSKSRASKTPITKEDLVAEMTKNPETGQTTIRWNNGAVYVGEIDHGEISGTGTMIYADSSRYQGQWKNDRFHGVGTMEYADGSAYCGQWENGDPNGQGTFLTSEGLKYTAEFKDGVPRGKCILQDIDGRMYTARWVRGKLKEKSIKPLKEK